MIDVIGKKCVGCGACVAACRKHCITMVADIEGFLYPSIDNSACIKCNACNKVCPALNIESGITNICVYGAYSKENKLVYNSSSGGVFSELANAFFELYPDGSLYGAAITQNMQVKHIKVRNIQEISRLRGSKYVQSDLNGIYKEILEYLKKGTAVYFSGTPCQISALKNFLKKDYPLLYTQAILCHGVPSPLVWDVYLKFIQKNQATEKKISEIRFRDKSYGWSNYSMSITFEDGSKYVRSSKEDAFLRAFGSGICLRPSCYECQFKYPNWQADITLGDFWNVETLEPNIYNKNGTSIVFILNEKGCNLLNMAKKNLTLYLTTINRAIEGQHGIVENLKQIRIERLFFQKLI